jgi:hypothetical protein
VETTSFLFCIHLLLLLPPLIHIRKPSSPVSLLCVLSCSNSDLQDPTLPSYILNALFFILSIYAPCKSHVKQYIARYLRLCLSHLVERVNVDGLLGETTKFNRYVKELQVGLVEAEKKIKELEDENERATGILIIVSERPRELQEQGNDS